MELKNNGHQQKNKQRKQLLQQSSELSEKKKGKMCQTNQCQNCAQLHVPLLLPRSLSGHQPCAAMDIQCWALDPLFSTFRHLLIATIQDDVKVIQKDEKFELYLFNRPIRKVYLLGTIVDLRLKNGRDHTTRAIFKLDDGTGVIECWKYINSCQESEFHLSLGDFVSANGVLYTQNSQFVVQLSAAEVCRDVNMEALHNLEAIHLTRTVYEQPLVNAVSQARSPALPPCPDARSVSSTAGGAPPVRTGSSDSDCPLYSGRCGAVVCPSLAQRMRSSNPFSCNCASLLAGGMGAGDEVLLVQREFLYCLCLARHHPLDPSGVSRVGLLFLLATEPLLPSEVVADDGHLEAVDDTPRVQTSALFSNTNFLRRFLERHHRGERLHRRRVWGERYDIENVREHDECVEREVAPAPPPDLVSTQERAALDLLWPLLQSLHAEGVLVLLEGGEGEAGGESGAGRRPKRKRETSTSNASSSSSSSSSAVLLLRVYDVLLQRVVEVALREFLSARKLEISDFACTKDVPPDEGCSGSGQDGMNPTADRSSAPNHANSRRHRSDFHRFIIAKARELIPQAVNIPAWKLKYCVQLILTHQQPPHRSNTTTQPLLPTSSSAN